MNQQWHKCGSTKTIWSLQLPTKVKRWEAYVDGRRAKILNADYLFRGVALEKGKHLVEFRYEPMSLYTGSIISLSALALSIGLIFISRKGRFLAPE